MIKTENIVPKISWSEITCGEACWNAKHDDCKCSCGGKNHGIWLKGKQAIRTSKKNGVVYKLLAVGKYRDLKEIQKIELVKYGIQRCYDYYGQGDFMHQTYLESFNCRGDKDTWGFPLVLNYATLRQCQKWRELTEFAAIDERKRYVLESALLWEVIDPPKPVTHKCGK